jgi:hypothetical protein
MKTSLSLAALLLLSGAKNSFADTIELNGITRLLGENMAFVVLHQPSQTKPVSFILSEGQSQFGIKLLAVDFAHHRAKIEQSGQVQDLRLCSAPDLTLPEASVENSGQPFAAIRISPQEQQQLNYFLNQDEYVQKLKSGSPVPIPAYPGFVGNKQSGNGSGNSTSSPGNSIGNNGTADQGGAQSGSSADSSTSSSSGSSSSSSAFTANSNTDYTKEYWYVTSRNIELNRLNTAPQVANGDMGPLPRTPLTPPNTASYLIGSDTFFPNHIPGFVYGGSVDGTDENGNPVP